MCQVSFSFTHRVHASLPRLNKTDTFLHLQPQLAINARLCPLKIEGFYIHGLEKAT